MKKRLLAILFLMTVMIFNINMVFADEIIEECLEEEIVTNELIETTSVAAVVDSGSCGTNLTYKIEKTVDNSYLLTIEGTGKMNNYELKEGREHLITTAPWGGYCQSKTKLVISQGVSSIGERAFYGCKGIVGELSFPNSVKTIGVRAFEDCTGLTGDLIIPDTVTQINEYAFFGCTGFDGELSLGNLKSIPIAAFYGCNNFTGNLAIPESVNVISGWAFLGCSGFDGKLSIPETVTSIGERAFDGCTGLTGDLIIPESVVSIEKSAFYGCKGFNGKLSIPNKLESINDYVFFNCEGLTGQLSIPESVTSIGDYAFYGCKGFRGDLFLPKKTLFVGEKAFYNCSGFDGNISILGVKGIEASAFEGCSNIHGTLTLATSLNSIGDKAFYGCKGLTGDLTLPRNVDSFGDYAFYGCSGFNGDLTILSPYVTRISTSLFEGCSGLTGNLIIPSDVESIGPSAFKGCSGLTGKLTIPESVVYLNKSAFENCSGFDGELVLPMNNKYGYMSIGASAFKGCSGLKGNLTIPLSVTKIDSNTFENCSGFDGGLTIPASVKTIGNSAFKGCTGFDGKLKLINNITNIGESAFEGCTGFVGNLIIPESVVGIEKSAFYGCKGFNGELIIPNTMSSIGVEVFEGCLGIKKINNNSLIELVLPNIYPNVWINKDGEIITKIAQGEAEKKICVIIKFQTNGGNISDESMTAYAGDAYGVLPSTDKRGYTFKGWYNSSTDGTIITATSVIPNENHILYAHWKANEYSVLFNANGGELENNSVTVVYDSLYGELPIPQRDGYSFVGWYDAEENGEKIEPTTIMNIACDHTLYAYWEKEDTEESTEKDTEEKIPSGNKIEKINISIGATNSTIVVDCDGGLVDGSFYVNKGKNIVLSKPTKEGSTFKAWIYTDAKTGKTKKLSKINEKLLASNPNLQIKAQWIENVYSITYKVVKPKGTAVFGKAIAQKKIKYSDEVTLADGVTAIEKATGKTYKVVGWAKTAGSKTVDYKLGEKVAKIGGQTKKDKKVILYPVWE